jgi:pimeloyl-ACP methyl ester carboxylesterase
MNWRYTFIFFDLKGVPCYDCFKGIYGRNSGRTPPSIYLKQEDIPVSNQGRFSNLFPVAFYNDLHPDFGVNFQMNRCYNFSNDDEMLSEMRTVSPLIHDYNEFITEFLKLYEKSLQNGHKLRAAHYLRTAEFYMTLDNPKKQEYRKQFIYLMREHFKIDDELHHLVPYEKGMLSAYRFTPETPKGVFVVFGGFDSYAEEMFKTVLAMKESGFDVIFFDGPGQGATLEDYHIPMTYEWEKPVKAILDFFKLEDVTLIGVSLGGYLVMRAAAYDKRIKRVVADDICTDFFETLLRQFPAKSRKFITFLVVHNNKINAALFNYFIHKLSKKSLMLEWGVAQGMHVMGATTPYEFLYKCTAFNTSKASPLVEQDVLLMGGQEDHYIPLHQFFDQGRMLTNVHSLTSRLFTHKETAHNHCQLGNIGLSVEVIVNWAEQMMDSIRE